MLILALFPIVKIETIQSPASVEWIGKLWYIHSTDYSVAVKMNEPQVYTSTGMLERV